MTCSVKAGLHVRRKHKHKRAFLFLSLVLASSRFTCGLRLVYTYGTSISVRSFFFRLCLRRPGSHAD